MRTVDGVKCFPVSWNVPGKLCDTCKTAAALLFCRKDKLFLCLACDLKIHSHTRHERVWMCEVCQQAPASVTCKADAAALCVTCDTDIHSANPLSRRHDRIPIVPFHDCADILMKSSACSFLETNGNCNGNGNGNDDLISSVTNDDEIDWRIPADMKSVAMLFTESDHLFDFEFPAPADSSIQSQFHDSVNDSVVPFHTASPEKLFQQSENRYEIDFTRSNINSYTKNSYITQSFSHSVSSSSIDAGVVTEGNSMSEISRPFVLQVKSGCEMNGVNESQQPMQLSGTDREARVMRYREKRKNRKFEKTIRYASRKAYAETRPRIKGRFAKRTESEELDADRWLLSASGVDVEYGVVPSYSRDF
ncbi:zinc finger protein CONSTANS-LIKE 5-like [Rutidosis leptorrhynchoides]|uniref:zinc finger protein CONSTANS-LIKE 5-like n=1 Tax=Rutidosis leptorrhynchoides TaxID=125765 RepID=UPI003A99FE1D